VHFATKKENRIVRADRYNNFATARAERENDHAKTESLAQPLLGLFAPSVAPDAEFPRIDWKLEAARGRSQQVSTCETTQHAPCGRVESRDEDRNLSYAPKRVAKPPIKVFLSQRHEKYGKRDDTPHYHGAATLHKIPVRG
jgi:hypothetical protein